MTAPAAAAIDLNADLGEGYGDWSMGEDAAMLDVVTTANIACGGHAGDARSMRAACRAAAARGVAITAHVAYPDLQGFGRRFLDIAPADLTDQVVVQVGTLQAMARAEGTSVRGVKPHGALYNALAHHEAQAGAVVRALGELGSLPLVAAPARRSSAGGGGGLSGARGLRGRVVLPDTRPALAARRRAHRSRGRDRARRCRCDRRRVRWPTGRGWSSRSAPVPAGTPECRRARQGGAPRLEEAGTGLRAAL